MIRARRWSFYVSVAAAGFGAVVNVVVLGLQLAQGHREAALYYGPVVAAQAALGWVLIWHEERIRTMQATRESYLVEQQADTRIKQFMIEKLESGQVTLDEVPVTTASRKH